ncbi:hypothetical protein niasHS_011365 [Heterodera schachtii]|uniref:Uncharacterized protein n=1 Tax=Heterodera schachtii TaxID=97005 RepID=A0ABD2IKK8_HETSC
MISSFVLLPLIALVLMIAMINPCLTLTCKAGYANQISDENATTEICKSKAHYCFSVMCMEQNYTSTALITWGCSGDADKKGCEQFFVNAANSALHSTKQRCECQFGDEGKDMANEQVKLPEKEKPGPIPTLSPEALEKSIRCKAGYFRGNGYGTTAASECRGGEYCYTVSCEIVSEMFTFWGCSMDNDCEEVSKFLAFGQKCQCQFGAKGENMGNLNFDSPNYLPMKGKIQIEFNELPIPTGRTSRENANIFIACSTIAFGFLTKFLLRAMMMVRVQ